MTKTPTEPTVIEFGPMSNGQRLWPNSRPRKNNSCVGNLLLSKLYGPMPKISRSAGHSVVS